MPRPEKNQIQPKWVKLVLQTSSFITIGGGAGTGRTTLARSLVDALQRQGTRCGYAAYEDVIHAVAALLQLPSQSAHSRPEHAVQVAKSYRLKLDDAGQVHVWPPGVKESTELPHHLFAGDQQKVLAAQLAANPDVYGYARQVIETQAVVSGNLLVVDCEDPLMFSGTAIQLWCNDAVAARRKRWLEDELRLHNALAFDRNAGGIVPAQAGEVHTIDTTNATPQKVLGCALSLLPNT